jgi:hypothetical protein
LLTVLSFIPVTGVPVAGNSIPLLGSSSPLSDSGLAIPVLVLAWYSVGFAVAAIARRRGHDPLAWSIGAALLGAALLPFAVVAVGARPRGLTRPEEAQRARFGPRRVVAAGRTVAPAAVAPAATGVVTSHLRVVAVVAALAHAPSAAGALARLGTRVDAPRLMAVLPVEAARGWLADGRHDAALRALDRLAELLAPWRPTATLEEGDLLTRLRERAQDADLVVVPGDLDGGAAWYGPGGLAATVANVLAVPVLVLPAVAAPVRPTEAA